MRVREFYCDTCDFRMPSGFGEYRYVITDDGTREKLQHPCEGLQIRNVLGENASDELIEERTGYVAYFACRTCAHVFEKDRQDEEVCPACTSSDVAAAVDLVGETCPQCTEGTVTSETIGIA